MAHLVVRETLGQDIALPEVPRHREIAGLGLSDVGAYAVPLAQKFSYENTWYHAEPRLDIARVPPERFARYDFVIASDVFEHVAPPVSRAFENVRKLLKPGGKLIFTVPFSLDPDTVEHFPDLHEWKLAERDGAWRLTNTTRAGETQTFDDLVFHGGLVRLPVRDVLDAHGRQPLHDQDLAAGRRDALHRICNAHRRFDLITHSWVLYSALVTLAIVALYQITEKNDENSDD
jgi:SAM-dependent methyltransferase